MDPLLPVLEGGRRLKLRRRKGGDAVFLRPGEPVLDRLRSLVCSRFAREALRGGVFIDPCARSPYLLHLALVVVSRRIDPRFRPFARGEIARPLAAQRQATLLETLPSRGTFFVRGYDYQAAEMATLRSKLGERVRAGDQLKALLVRARGGVIVDEQQVLAAAERDQ